MSAATLGGLPALILGFLEGGALRAAAVLLAACLGTLFMRRASAAARHLMWVAAIVVALLAPIGSAFLPKYWIPVLPARKSPVQVATNSVAPSMREVGSDARTVGIRADWEPKDLDHGSGVEYARRESWTQMPMGNEASVKPISVPAATSTALRPSLAFTPTVIVGIYVCGAALVTAYWLIGIVAAWRLTQRAHEVLDARILAAMGSAHRDLGLRRHVELRSGAGVSMPLAWGFVRAYVLLPEAADGWSAEQLRSVLLHELAHVKRLDCWTQQLAHLACSLHWFNPLAWLAAVSLRVERERACDDLVIRHGESPTSYEEHLLEVARGVRGRSFPEVGAIAMARSSGLRRRVLSILDGRVNRLALSRRLAVTAVFVAAAVLFPLASLRLSERQVAHAESVATTQPTSQPTRMPQATVQPTSRAKQMLRLTVLDKLSGRPIAGARIHVAGVDKQVQADDKGEVTVDLSSGVFPWVMAQHAGYVGKRIQWGTRKQPEKPPATYTVRLDHGATIGGRVVDDAGQPIGGAFVRLAFSPGATNDRHESLFVGPQILTTSADGSWHCDEIPAKVESFRIGAWDYHHAVENGFAVQEYSSIDAVRNLTLTLKRGIEVTGKVYGPDGKALAGAKLGLGPELGIEIPDLTTDADGAFSLAVQHNTLVVLTVRAKGCAPDLQQRVMDAAPISFEFHLKPASVITGTVVNAAGDPVSRAFVTFDTWRGARSNHHLERTDNQGQFAWKDAPPDTVYVNVRAPGYTGQEDVAMTAGQNTRVVLQKQLEVSGTVVDGDGGAPIQSFRIIHGFLPPNSRRIIWERDTGIETGAAGRFTFSEQDSEPAYAARIEADGYVGAESRTFSGSEGHVQLEFKLKKGSDLTVHVTTTDGKAAAGATAVLVEPDEFVTILQCKKIPFFRGQSSTVAADGTVHFQPVVGEYAVTVFGDSGYAEVTSQQWQSSQSIVLRAWASIRGQLLIGSEPGASQEINVERRRDWSGIFANSHKPRIVFQIRTQTDNLGYFTVPRVPADVLWVSREVDQVEGQVWRQGRAQTQTISPSPGETVSVTLGGQGRAVIGHIQIPTQLIGRNDWIIMGTDATNTAQPPDVQMPPEVAAGTREQRQAWVRNFESSDAGKKNDVMLQEFRLNHPSYPAAIAQDGSFRIDDVGPGTYKVVFRISRHTHVGSGREDIGIGPQAVIASGEATFTVPEMPGGRSDQALEIPPVAMSMVEPRAQLTIGDSAPDFSLTTLDGKPIKLSDLRGKYVLLDFWATWCSGCVAEMPNLKATYDAFGKSGRFVMISMSFDNKREDAQKFVQENHLGWSQIFLPDGVDSPTGKAYGIEGLPWVWLIDPNGKIVNSQLEGEDIKPTVATALGASCGG